MRLLCFASFRFILFRLDKEKVDRGECVKGAGVVYWEGRGGVTTVPY